MDVYDIFEEAFPVQAVTHQDNFSFEDDHVDIKPCGVEDKKSKRKIKELIVSMVEAFVI